MRGNKVVSEKVRLSYFKYNKIRNGTNVGQML